MRRAIVILVALVALTGAWLLFNSTKDDPYLVRAVFDNGAFVVNDEDVRVAGATVGSVESVDVSLPGEVVSEQEGISETNPGKAVVVMRIDDPRFQDWRTDASCLIRPQSLIGEKFIDCNPTLERAPGSEPAPELTEIPDDQPGAGQRLLPLENNGKTVDVDLLNNVMRRPYAERLRLILSDLGAALAGRGEDLREVIRRGNPVLRDATRVLHQLAVQNKGLAQLASDSDAILAPLARERQHVAGFITNAGAAAEVTAANGADLEAAWQKFPAFLRELDSTMAELQGFAEETQPVMDDFGEAAPYLTTATRRFKPFAANSIGALRTLGAAGEEAAPKLNAAIPVIGKTARLVQTGAKPLTDSASFLGSFRETKGFERLMDLIYNTGGAMNGFDSYGHYLRSVALPTNCTDYQPAPPVTGCMALFGKDKGGKSVAAIAAEYRRAHPNRPNGKQRLEGGIGPSQTEGFLNFLLQP
jgi:phospholipid/cholesterol/gamma-HCH transport system substrate-binding protein